MSSRGRWSLRVGVAIPVVLALLLSPSVAAAAVPSIESESVSGITSTNAILEAQISPPPEGYAHYQFQLVTDPEEFASEILCPEPPRGFALCIGEYAEGALRIGFIFEEAAPVSLDLSSEGVTLQAGTTYHYRVLAATAIRTEDTIEWEPPIVYGADQTFTTLSEPGIPLTLKKDGTGTGTVVSNPAGINCSTACPEETAEFEEGSLVTLTASAASSSIFKSWAGCTKTIEGTGVHGRKCTVQMTKALTVKAKFEAANQIAIAKEGAGQGTVSSSPSGISCGLSCTTATALFETSKIVLLKAVPVASSSEFEAWGAGDCDAEPEGKCQVSAASAHSVTAKFKAIPQSTLSFEMTGPGTGTVSSSPAGISCGTACTKTSANYLETKIVLLKAVPKTGEEFGGWTGCDSVNGEGKCVVAMTSNKSVTAEFK